MSFWLTAETLGSECDLTTAWFYLRGSLAGLTGRGSVFFPVQRKGPTGRATRHGRCFCVHPRPKRVLIGYIGYNAVFMRGGGTFLIGYIAVLVTGGKVGFDQWVCRL